jgi:hypothetical protein
MKFLALASLLVVISVVVAAQCKNDLGALRLNGRVKALNESAYDVLRYGTKYKKGGLTSKTTILFDEKGNETESTAINGVGYILDKTVFKHAPGGAVIAGVSTRRHNNLMWKNKLTCDGNGNVTDLIGYDHKGTITHKSSYRYDHRGHLIQKDEMDKNGRLITEFVYKNDAYGNKITEEMYRIDAGSMDRLNYIYTGYDKGHNWLRKTTFMNGKPIKTTERLITYY